QRGGGRDGGIKERRCKAVRVEGPRDKASRRDEAEQKALVRHSEVRRLMSATDLLRAELTRAARSLGAPDAIQPALERPRAPAFGDWATNLALVLAKPLRAKPRDLAQGIVKALDFRRAGIRSADIAGPGFINFRVDVDVVVHGIGALIAADESYGRSDAGRGRPVNVGFVSATPTGPLH